MCGTRNWISLQRVGSSTCAAKRNWYYVCWGLMDILNDMYVREGNAVACGDFRHRTTWSWLGKWGKWRLWSWKKMSMSAGPGNRSPYTPTPAQVQGKALGWDEKRNYLHLNDNRFYHTDPKRFHTYYTVYCYCFEVRFSVSSHRSARRRFKHKRQRVKRVTPQHVSQ